MTFNVSKFFLGIASLLIFNSACSTAPQRMAANSAEEFNTSPVGETYYDGNRAPASMSPPFDMSPEKITLDPIYMRTKADYHFALGETYSFEGDSARAIEEYKLTSVYDPKSPVVRFKLAVEYIKKGLVSEGLVHAEEAVKLNPNYIDARLLLGGVYTALKLYDKAEEQYRYVLKTDEGKKEATLYLGALLAEQKKYKDAVQVFQKLADDKEYDSPYVAYYYMGRVELEKGDKKAAEQAFSKSLQIKPSYVESVLALGTFYEADNKRKRAFMLYESYQDKHGPDEKVAEILSRMYLEDEKYEKAYTQLEYVVAADPSNLNAKVKLALILIETKEFKKAIQKLKDILAQAPDSDKIRFFLGAVYEEVKDYSAAIEQFQQIGPTSSYYVESVVHASYLYKVKNDYDNAFEVIEKGISLRPDAIQFYPLYASYLDDTRQFDKAVDMLKKAVIKFPTSDQLYFFLGSMQDKVGNRKETVSNMKKTIEINPEHVQALNYLAYTYAEQGENLDEAYKYARKALEIKPDDAFIQDTVGWIYYKKGNYADAVKVLEAAFNVKSDESIIAEHLGDAYFKFKLVDKAKDMYRHAIKYESNESVRRKIQSKISAIENVGKSPRSPASVADGD